MSKSFTFKSLVKMNDGQRIWQKVEAKNSLEARKILESIHGKGTVTSGPVRAK